mmetsp:Transcript_9923/g.60570  ORF Transcript_9923/g.60570 Transcript_9923/m.60570 type:complete len:675 (+) Transcript_9923:1242-3266(+)
MANPARADESSDTFQSPWNDTRRSLHVNPKTTIKAAKALESALRSKVAKELVRGTLRIAFVHVLLDLWNQAWIVEASFHMPKLVLVLSGVVVGVGIGLWFSGKKSKLHYKKAAIFEELREMKQKHIQKLIGEMPAWIKFKDFDNVAWLNRALVQAWPAIDLAVCRVIRDAVTPLLQEVSVGLNNAPVQEILLQELSFGNKPPYIAGVKVFDKIHEEDELVVEMDVRWGGGGTSDGGDASAELRANIYNHTLPIRLTRLQMVGTVRLVLKPFLPVLPVFGTASFAFVARPMFDFSVEVLGADIMALPIISQVIRQALLQTVTDRLLWPKQIVIPLAGNRLARQYVQKPIGELRLRLVKGVGLKNTHRIHFPNPWAELQLSGRDRVRSAAKLQTTSPEWNETFAFVVDQLDGQSLGIQIFDKNFFGSRYCIGEALVPVKEVMPGNQKYRVTAELVSTSHARVMRSSTGSFNSLGPLHLTPVEGYVGPAAQKRGLFHNWSLRRHFRQQQEPDEGLSNLSTTQQEHGSLLMEMVFCPFLDHTEVGQQAVHFKGALRVKVIHASNLRSVGCWGTQNIFIRLRAGRQTHDSRIVRNNLSPTWNDEFYFHDIYAQDTLIVECLCKRTIRTSLLGSCVILMPDVVVNGSVSDTFKFQEVSQGEIKLQLEWFPVQSQGQASSS